MVDAIVTMPSNCLLTLTRELTPAETIIGIIETNITCRHQIECTAIQSVEMTSQREGVLTAELEDAVKAAVEVGVKIEVGAVVETVNMSPTMVEAVCKELGMKMAYDIAEIDPIVALMTLIILIVDQLAWAATSIEMIELVIEIMAAQTHIDARVAIDMNPNAPLEMIEIHIVAEIE